MNIKLDARIFNGKNKLINSKLNSSINWKDSLNLIDFLLKINNKKIIRGVIL